MARSNFRTQLRTFRILIVVLLLLILSGFALVVFCTMEETVEGRGVVEGMREYELKSSVQSRIKRIHKKNGDPVKAGELLLELEDRDLQGEIEMLRNAISELEVEIVVKTWSLAVLKHDPLPPEYRYTTITLEECRERVEKSKFELETFRGLYEKGVISLMELQKKEMEHLKNTSELQKLETDYAKLQDGLAEKIIAQAENELELLKLRLKGRQSELKIKEAAENEYRFLAPEDGTISYIPTKLGSYVEPGETLISMAAAGPKKFIAFIDEQQIHKVRENQAVRISSSQYNYFDYGYFKGKVYLIEELPETRGDRTYYRVRILIEDEPYPLRLGSTGEAEIITGRNRIIRFLTGFDK
ncbi:HlyD family secretion protein [Victivallis sp. Marseille-Q1083]|uniref:HlyD family secretion protein n=1 Tax=Victivallis sp. Marseille-Q1083 TaxID=2717288 RepID=UPI00158CCC6B|nr:HlyD family efflux transporter periplasmic adaptor subunit [Victivallis sp. Marseille-Q1083]